MALPNVTVEIAFDSGYTTPAASRTWTDVSAYVEGAQALTINRGRADEVSQVQPSRLALTLNNADGRFTPRLTTGAYYPDVKKGRPVRVTATYNAVGYVRYTGYVSEWPVSWPDSSSAVCVVNLTSASRMARLGRGAELRSIVEEEIATDDPVAHYTLGEPADSTSAADTSGNQATALIPAGSGADVVFGNATGPGTDGLTAAEFANGKYLSGPTSVVLPMAANGATIGFFFSTAAGSATSYIVSDASGSIFARVTAGGLLEVGVRSTTITSGATVTDSAVHHGAFKFDAAGTTMTLLLDGVSQGTAAVSDTSIIGLLVGSGFTGAISHVAAFDSTLSNTRLAAHSDAGLTGLAGESAGSRIERYAAYGLIPAAEVSADPGSSTIGHFDITGMTPIAAMQKVVETENGTLFDAKNGDLTLTGRDARYNLASSFTLDVTAQEIEADLEPKDDDQFVVNDVTADANGVPAGRVVDATSVDENGRYTQSLDTVTDDTSDALAGAQWRVGKGKDPEPRYSQVTVDITNSSTAQAAAALSADIGTKFTLTNLPAQAPASSVELFVEGYTETITATRHTITFNTSPAAGYTVWQLGRAGYSELGSTTLLAY